jgi:hypothetical protein
MAVEAMHLGADFYVKTLHSSDYWSFTPERQKNNVWCTSPEETIEFLENVDKPWIAYKVLAAGAIHPGVGFPYAFTRGANFICVGMFDWQIEADVRLAPGQWPKPDRWDEKDRGAADDCFSAPASANTIAARLSL